MTMQQYSISGSSVAKRGTRVIVADNTGAPHMLINSDINDTIWLGHQAYVSSSDANSIPLSPQSFLIVDGRDDVWAACDPNASAILYVVDGGAGYFQSGITSGSFLLNNDGFFMYSPTKGAGNLIFAEVPKDVFDPYGNFAAQGLSVIDTVFGGVIHINGARMVITGGLSQFFSLDPAKLVMYTSAGGALGHQSVSLATADTTDQYGNAILAGLASYNGAAQIVQMIAGQVLFKGAGITTPGVMQDFGGSMQIQSSQFGAGDTNCSIILQAKNQSNDGLHPEFVFQNRAQMQDEFGAPTGIVSVDPNSPNADESIHNFAFAPNFSQAAGRVPTSFYRTAMGVFASGNVKQHICVRGSIVSANAAPLAGTAMTQAMGAGYGISPGQSIHMFNLTGNVSLRGFVTGTGVIQISGPTAGIAVNDIIDIPAQYLLAT